MNYQIVTLEETIVAGLEARTNNASPQMKDIIGGLWRQFYEAGVYEELCQQKREKVLGIYHHYESDHRGAYDILAGCRVKESTPLPFNTVSAVIQAGRYAKFKLTGPLHEVVGQFWSQVWQMDIPRSFVCDFEEYQGGDPENMEIHFYIGLETDKKQ